MKTKPQYITAILGFALLSATMGIPQVLAVTNSWFASGAGIPNASASELASHLGVPPLPSTSAEPSTILWVGGNSANNAYLDQPGIRALSSTHWTGVLEVYSYSAQSDAELDDVTNVSLSSGDTAVLDVYLTGAGWSCQTVTDTTTSATASYCFKAHNYGTTFNNASGELESYYNTSSYFHPMDGTISFTSFNQYVSGVASSVTLQSNNGGAGAWTGPPSCVSSSGGTGSASITLTNC